MDNAKEISEKEKKEIMYIFSTRLAKMYIRLGDRKKAYSELKKMLTIHKINKKNTQIILGILANKLYIKIANGKDKKRKE